VSTDILWKVLRHCGLTETDQHDYIQYEGYRVIHGGGLTWYRAGTHVIAFFVYSGCRFNHKTKYEK